MTGMQNVLANIAVVQTEVTEITSHTGPYDAPFDGNSMVRAQMPQIYPPESAKKKSSQFDSREAYNLIDIGKKR